MSSPFLSRPLRRKRTDPDGSRWAVGRGLPDIPFTPNVAPVVGVLTDRVTRLRLRSLGTPAAPGVRTTAVLATQAMNIPVTPASWVGVPAGTTLTRYPASGNADFVANSTHANAKPGTGSGVIIENLEIFGSVNLGTIANTYIRNCIIWGPVATSGTPFITGSSNNLRGNLCVDSELKGRIYATPSAPNYFARAMQGANHTIERCEIHGTSDGFGFTSNLGGQQILGCWVHDGLYGEWTPPNANYPSSTGNYLHSDAFQIQLGKNIVIRGNYIGGRRTGPYIHNTGHPTEMIAGDDYPNTLFMIKQEVDATAANKIENVLIEQNVLWGSEACINMNTNLGNLLESVDIQNNLFPYPPWVGSQVYVYKPPDFAGTLTNNRHPEDGTLINISAGA